jgi:hypothetical protein
MIHRINDAAVELYRKTSTKGHESCKQDVAPHKAYLPPHSELSKNQSYYYPALLNSKTLNALNDGVISFQ